MLTERARTDMQNALRAPQLQQPVITWRQTRLIHVPDLREFRRTIGAVRDRSSVVHDVASWRHGRRAYDRGRFSCDGPVSRR